MLAPQGYVIVGIGPGVVKCKENIVISTRGGGGIQASNNFNGISSNKFGIQWWKGIG